MEKPPRKDPRGIERLTALQKVRGEYPSRSPGYVKPRHTPRGVKDAEQLTPMQRAWVELMVDFRNTIYECARIAGYANPPVIVREMYRNPYVVRAILRRYHKRMLQLARAFAPQLKFVKEVEKPRRRSVYVRVSRQGEPRERVVIPVTEREIAERILGDRKE